MTVILAPRARRDLIGIQIYLTNENPAAAKTILAAMISSIENLDRFPCLGRRLINNRDRRLHISGTVYLAYYRVVGDDILVLHVQDARRTPYRA